MFLFFFLLVDFHVENFKDDIVYLNKDLNNSSHEDIKYLLGNSYSQNRNSTIEEPKRKALTISINFDLQFPIGLHGFM